MGMPGGGVMSTETAPAVGTPGAGDGTAEGCRTAISCVAAQPHTLKAAASNASLRDRPMGTPRLLASDPAETETPLGSTSPEGRPYESFQHIACLIRDWPSFRPHESPLTGRDNSLREIEYRSDQSSRQGRLNPDIAEFSPHPPNVRVGRIRRKCKGCSIL